MGASPYWYFVPYQENVQSALERLRAREFEAGRYYPVMHPLLDRLEFGAPSFEERAPGRQHDSIEEAQMEAAEEGTKSILDLSTVGETPNFCVAARMSSAELKSATGSTRPTRAQLESGMSALLESIHRGMGAYAVIYEDSAPREIWFAGYSFD